MALPDWVLIAGIASAIIAPVIGALKVKPEARKMKQDGTAALMTSTGTLLSSVQEEMTELRTEVKSLRTWRTHIERMWRQHSRWDDHMMTQATAAGLTVADPPPLFEDVQDK